MEKQWDSENSDESTLPHFVLKILEEKGIHCRKVIGKGTFSSVRAGWHDKLKLDVALKIIKAKPGADFTERFLPREKHILQQLNHKNIIETFETIEKHSYVCFVQEYALHGDLLQKIKRNGRIDELESRFYFRQLIEALSYLKSLNVAHRDIKCENLLLDSCDNVKLADFGFARFMKPGEKSVTFCGSRAYVAPELLRSHPYNGLLADIWSAGIVLYVMVTGFMPYDDRDTKQMLEKQLQHKITFSRRRPVSTEVKELIRAMVHPDPLQRRSYDKVITSSWLINTKYEIRSEQTSREHDSPSP